MTTKLISVRLSEDDRAKIKAIAEREERSVAQMMRLLLREAVKQRENNRGDPWLNRI